MSNIQNRLSNLKPYVVGIRFIENISVIDVVLKQGWTIPKSSVILHTEAEKDTNVFIFFSQSEGIGIDEILDYIEKVINLNLEREKKQILFKEKIKEMQEFFKKNKLSDLINMRFELADNNFEGEDLEHDIHEEEQIIENNEINKTVVMENTEENKPEPIKIESKEQLKEIFDEKPIIKENMTEEELEEEEAIARAKAFRDNKDKFKLTGNKTNTKHGKVELPPKDFINDAQDLTCNCGDSLDKICGVCADRKSL